MFCVNLLDRLIELKLVLWLLCYRSIFANIRGTNELIFLWNLKKVLFVNVDFIVEINSNILRIYILNL